VSRPKRRKTRTTPGAFLTDGVRLVEVCQHLEQEGLLVVQDVRTPLDRLDRFTIPMKQARTRWRLVTPDA
jgi:hypothetical protein